MKANKIFDYWITGVTISWCLNVTACIGWGGHGGEETNKNMPIIIFKDTNVVLGDSVRIQIYMPGYSKNPLPCITIDTINDSATGTEHALVEDGIGYYNDFPTKVGVNIFSGTILVKEINNNKVDSFHFRSQYMVIKPKNRE